MALIVLMIFVSQLGSGLLAEICNLERQIICLDFYRDVSGTVYRADELLLQQQLLLSPLCGHNKNSERSLSET